jgi:hypothetical protein
MLRSCFKGFSYLLPELIINLQRESLAEYIDLNPRLIVLNMSVVVGVRQVVHTYEPQNFKGSYC